MTKLRIRPFPRGRHLSRVIAGTLLVACTAMYTPANQPQPVPAAEKELATMKITEHRSGQWSPALTAAEQKTLFTIAHDTLAWCVQPQRAAFPFERYALTARLREPMATFVTLKDQGALRGCIGSLAAEEPLYLSVHHNTMNAALHDFRFTPVTAREITRLTLDVSLLSPLREIAESTAFIPGTHGIILQKGTARAVFLPEVATEQGWSREDTLTHLSLKAGLPANAWRKNARFQVFESVVLSVVRADGK